MSPATLELPPLRAIARHALPRVVEGVLVPTLLFLTLLRLGGPSWAIVGALVWSTLVIATRLGTGRPIPTIVFLGLAALGLRSAIALAADSSFLYFLQPTIGTALVGIVILASALAGRPLVLRIARDFCPLPADVMAHDHLRRFFLGISFLWGAVQLINAGVTFWLLLNQSLGTFVVVRSTLVYSLTAAAIAVSVMWFRRISRPVPAPIPVPASTRALEHA